MDVQTQINSLRDELREHNYNYYVNDNPTISDFEFDKKLEQLKALEAAHPEFYDAASPSVRVGGEVTKNFNTIKHINRMYSLDNSYSLEDLQDWETRIKKIVDGDIQYTCELKYDGASISLHYENGKFVQAVTRGDGNQGDEVTANVRTIKSVPLQLKGDDVPAKFEIRGEIVLPWDGFHKMNEERAAQGLELYRNPRNTASGSLKLQDSAEVAKRPLDCLLYQLAGDNLPIKTQFDSLTLARKWGFKAPKESKLVHSIEEVFEFINHWDIARKEMPYETDGVVVKVNSLRQQEELGFTAKAPKWAMAYKFATEQVSTRLEEITYQVGRTGSITPVANLDAVEISGTTVRRASLHNADQIEKLDIRVGDEVYVEKGGEIIPKIVAVDLSKRPADSVPTVYATHCPECQTELVRKEDDAKHFCPNEMACPPQVKGRIEHFASRRAMDIDGLGEGIIELLYQKGLVKNYADLYDLNKEDLVDLFMYKSDENSGLKYENQLQIPIVSAIYGFYVDNSKVTRASIEKQMPSSFVLSDFISKLNFDNTQDPIINFFWNYSNIQTENHKHLENHISLDALAEMKYTNSERINPNGFKTADYVSEFFEENEGEWKEDDKYFDQFLIRINDRNRVGLQEKGAESLIASIEESKSVPFERTLFALGISNIGEVVAKKLARFYKSMDALIAMPNEPNKQNLDLFADTTSAKDKKLNELTAIPEIGGVIAKSLIEFITDEKQLQILERLMQKGLQFSLSEEQLKGQTDKLQGKSFVISGRFLMSRDEIKKLIEKNGGKLSSSLSSKTDYLVRGEDMGPSKLEKAEKLEIKMISEQELLNMVEL